MRGYILAGGRSRRFGSDKAVFLIEGRPLVLRLAATLAQAGLEPWLIAKAPRELGLPELIEPPDVFHPLWGLALGLETGDAFFCPCDLVDLRIEQVQALLAARAIAADQPLLGWFPAALAARARVHAQKNGPVRVFVADLPRIDVGPVRNMNTPG